MKKLYPGIIFIVIFISAVVIYYRYSTGKTEKILEQLKKEYPSIAIDEKINATVTNIDHGDPEIFRNHPHQAYLILDNSIKKRIRTGYELTQELMLDEVLEEGERLVKGYGTDTLYIYKIQSEDTLKYTFQLRDDLGYPLEKAD